MPSSAVVAPSRARIDSPCRQPSDSASTIVPTADQPSTADSSPEDCGTDRVRAASTRTSEKGAQRQRLQAPNLKVAGSNPAPATHRKKAALIGAVFCWLPPSLRASEKRHAVPFRGPNHYPLGNRHM